MKAGIICKKRSKGIKEFFFLLVLAGYSILFTDNEFGRSRTQGVSEADFVSVVVVMIIIALRFLLHNIVISYDLFAILQCRVHIPYSKSSVKLEGRL